MNLQDRLYIRGGREETFNKKYNTRYNTQHQISLHLDVDLRTCPVCSKKFKRRCDAKKHMLNVHSDIKPVTCMKCSKKFKYHGNMRRHLKESHCDISQIACSKSGKKFMNRSTVSHHMQYVHSDILPVSCPKCAKKFKYRLNMQRHLRESHHDSSGIQTVECPKCAKRYSTDNSMRRHLRRFHPELNQFACPYCQIMFGSNLSLQRHLKIHSNLADDTRTTYVCPVCNKTFYVHDAMLAHMLKYGHDIKLYACENCDQTFLHPFDLEQHVTNAECCRDVDIPLNCNGDYQESNHVKQLRDQTDIGEVMLSNGDHGDEYEYQTQLYNGDYYNGIQTIGQQQPTAEYWLTDDTGHLLEQNEQHPVMVDNNNNYYYNNNNNNNYVNYNNNNNYNYNNSNDASMDNSFNSSSLPNLSGHKSQHYHLTCHQKSSGPSHDSNTSLSYISRDNCVICIALSRVLWSHLNDHGDNDLPGQCSGQFMLQVRNESTSQPCCLASEWTQELPTEQVSSTSNPMDSQQTNLSSDCLELLSNTLSSLHYDSTKSLIDSNMSSSLLSFSESVNDTLVSLLSSFVEQLEPVDASESVPSLPSESRSEATTVGSIPFVCRYCYREFADSELLAAHESRHMGDSGFTCWLCLEEYYDEFTLAAHNYECHSQEC